MKHILIVDDVATNLKCAAEILKDTYEVSTAKNARQALEIIKTHKPDMVLAEMDLAGVSGMELFEKMKEDAECVEVPMVFCTSVNDRSIAETGIRAGALDCICKPYVPEILCQHMDRAFKRHEMLLSRTEHGAEANIKLFPKKNLERLKEVADNKLTKGYLILLLLSNYGKIYNVFGEDATEEIFRKTENVLDEELGKGHCLCHMENDIFAAYVEGALSKNHIKTLVRRVIAGVEFEVNEGFSEESDLKISVSAGIAAKPEDGITYEKLKDCAGKALYYVKQSGKRGYHFYSSDPEEENGQDAEKSTVNVLQVERLLKNRYGENPKEDISLDKAHQILVRCLTGKRDSGQMILFSLFETEQKDHAVMMETFEDVIADSLRKGDAAFVCGITQHLVVLNQASVENAKMVAERIKDKFYKTIKENHVRVECQMRSI